MINTRKVRSFLQKQTKPCEPVAALFKWIALSLLTGIVTGLVGTAFFHLLALAARLFQLHSQLLYALPVLGLSIVCLYRRFWPDRPGDTNLVLSSLSTHERIPLRMVPLIFVSTILTHLGGGSAGREGAALQIGGSLGAFLGKLFRFDDKGKEILVMCGMSAAFAALFGTPATAAVFALEVAHVGIMRYFALLPCVISAIAARLVAHRFHVEAEHFPVALLPELSAGSAVKLLLLGIFCGLLSLIFCMLLHKVGDLFARFFKNPYLRVVAGGMTIIVLTLLMGHRNYNGAGTAIIAAAVAGEAAGGAFALKILFTAITLGSGFKGGEIVPTLYVGATFGCTLGGILGIPAPAAAAAGMAALFCGVTNCPITALVLSIELFGSEGICLYILAIAASYVASGYHSLYHVQKIMHSKYEASYRTPETH